MARNKFTVTSTFGARLHDSMVIAGVSSSRLAKMRGVSRQTVRDWLRMPIARLSGEHLACIGMALGVSVRWLALGVGTPVPLGLEAARKEFISSEASDGVTDVDVVRPRYEPDDRERQRKQNQSKVMKAVWARRRAAGKSSSEDSGPSTKPHLPDGESHA